MAETLKIGSSLNINENFNLVNKTNSGWKVVDTLYASLWGTIRATNEGNTVKVTASIFGNWWQAGGSSGSVSNYGAGIALVVDSESDLSRNDAIIFGENGGSSTNYTQYSKEISITLDKRVNERTVRIEFLLGPAYDGELIYADGIGPTVIQIDITVPKIVTLTLIMGNGVKSFTCSDANSQNGNVYTFDYGDSASTTTEASTGYVLSSHSGTNANGVGERTWPGCAGSTKYPLTDEWTMNANRTITANAIPITYTVKYNSNAINTSGSTANSSHTYNTATTLTKNGFTKTGYTFHHWNTQSNDSGTKYDDQASVKNLTTTNGATVNLYALWSPIKYKVTYNANGGTGTTSQSEHTYDMEKNLTANGFTKTGYTFVGWNTKSDGTGTPYADEDSVKNITTTNNAIVNLYAVWQPNKVHLVYHSAGGVCDGGDDTTKWENAGIYEEDVVILEEQYNVESSDIVLRPHTSDGDEYITISREGYDKLYSNSWDAHQSPKIDWDTESVNKIVDVKSYDDYFALCEELGVSTEEPETTVHLYIVWSPIIVKIELEDNIDIFYHFLHCKEQDDGRISYYYTDSNLEAPIYKLDSLPSAVGREFEGYYINDGIEELVDKYGNLNDDSVVYAYAEDRVATIKWKYLASMYAKSGDSHKHGLVYIRMADGTYKMGAGVYVKVDGDWKISTK